MAKYAVVDIYCDAKGGNRAYSKPDKIFTSIKDARLHAKKKYTPQHGAGWIVQIFSDGAEVLGQVWNLRGVWMFEKKPKDTLFVLKSDGSLGAEVNWKKLNENPRYYQKMM